MAEERITAMKKRSITLIVSIVVFTISIIMFASSASYNDTIPTLVDKTVATGWKSTTAIDAYHTLLNSSQRGCRVWVDHYNANGNWVTVTAKTWFDPGQGMSLPYSAVPVVGSSVRLRVGANLGNGGKTILGTINFK